MHSDGILRLVRNEWHFRGSPEVMATFKRIFPGKSRRDKNTQSLCVGHTPQMCRDLEWFCQRYTIEIQPHDLLLQSAAQHRESTALARDLVSGVYLPSPAPLAVPLRNYQNVAVALALATRGLLLADDLGLGKTATAIGCLVDASVRPALVVTATHLTLQWQRELKRFAPDLTSWVLPHGAPRPLVDHATRKPYDVIICNYHKLATWRDRLVGHIKGVVYDEVQEMRHQGTQKYDAGAAISHAATFRLGLSATPIYNHGDEFWSVMDVIRPYYMGTMAEFADTWCSDGRKIRDPVAFGAYLRREGLMLRRTRAEAGRELPQLTRVTHDIQHDAIAFKKHSAGALELAQKLLSSDSKTADRFTAAGQLDMRIRHATGVAKATYVAMFVKMILEGSDEKVLLVGWHKDVYAIWNTELAEYHPVMFTGDESVAQKDEARRRFVEGNSRVLIMSLRAGAGLDGLQHVCKTVVFGELDWSPQVHSQCLSDDTEILTPRGFVRRDAVAVGDSMFAFGLDGKIHQTYITDKVDRPLAEGEYMVGTVTHDIDVRVTDKHRMIVRRKMRTLRGARRSAWEFTEAHNLVGASRRSVPVCGMQDSAGVPLTSDELVVLGLYLADGSHNGRQLMIYQSEHQPWNEDIEAALRGSGLRYLRYTRRRRSTGAHAVHYYVVGKGKRVWLLDEVQALRKGLAAGHSVGELAAMCGRTPLAVTKKIRRGFTKSRYAPNNRRGTGYERLEPYLDKDVSPLLEDMTRDQLMHLLHGINLGDGRKQAKYTWIITSVNKTFVDRLQSLCIRRNISAHISTRTTRTSAGNSVYDLHVTPDMYEASLPGSAKPNNFAKQAHKPGERVWCVTNEYGTIITRRNGKVAIVGNCIGRLHRDGQRDCTLAYFLVTDDGSDPLIAELLGLKRAQHDGVVDLVKPGELSDNALAGADDGRIARLAAAYVERHLTR